MRKIDTKYTLDGTITKYDGSIIPNDEPLFLFRAKDRLLPKVLAYYRKLRVQAGTPPEHLKRMDDQIKAIEEWQKTHYTQTPQ